MDQPLSAIERLEQIMAVIRDIEETERKKTEAQAKMRR